MCNNAIRYAGIITMLSVDTRCVSQWEKSFMTKEELAEWGARRKRRVRPQGMNWFFSFHVDYEDLADRESSLRAIECKYLSVTKRDWKGAVYVEGMVAWGRQRSYAYTYERMMRVNPKRGVLISRLQYNRWQEWYAQYHEEVWFETGQREEFWRKYEEMCEKLRRDTVKKEEKARVAKRKWEDKQVDMEEVDIRSLSPRVNKLVEDSMELKEEIRKRVLELLESDTEIDEPDLR